ncbi:hypothetical protein ABEB36_008291 [Hypothenemus hampei]|uniref:Uncharacterized protein n=1 Tax=Hypothenemus hampei TaxID=57062 RepID=A0ABD1ELY2_HYPHA
MSTTLRYGADEFHSSFFSCSAIPALYTDGAKIIIFVVCRSKKKKLRWRTFYMISSHDETQPETLPTSAATSPSLPSSPPLSSIISVEGSLDGSVARLVDSRNQ